MSGAAGVGQYAAIAEGARSKFHAALEPADHFAGGDLGGGLIHQLRLAQAAIGDAGGFQLREDFAVAVLRAHSKHGCMTKERG
jgi:hypothetical protein